MSALLLAAALATPPALADAERLYAAYVEADDRARAEATPKNIAARDERERRARAALAAVPPAGLGEGDRRALAVMTHAVAPPATRLDPRARVVYQDYGAAAEAVVWNGQTLDRLTILGRLTDEPDPAVRKSLFEALAPVWATMAGQPGEPSPYRDLVGVRVFDWKRSGEPTPFARKAAEWGVTEDRLEAWLVQVLEAWRSTLSGPAVEPWDWYYATGAADRRVAQQLTLATNVKLAKRYYTQLGASPKAIHLQLDLSPRAGKDPVAFTDFLTHGYEASGHWKPAELRVSATYRTGGLGNLYELMHEMGHAAHIAAIRGRPAFDDWPDSDVLTEALADVLGVEVYEPAWQRRYLGYSADRAELIRSRLSGSMLDIAWALLEMRLHRDPGVDPSVVWAELTSRYLGIVPHPELPWWAMRGQLIDAPGYMTNYALGAILTESLRARTAAVRGETTLADPTPELYSWLSERLYRYGLARSSREVVEEFLGGPPGPEPLVRRITEIALAFPGRTR